MKEITIDHYRLLVRIYGELDALHWLPASGRCGANLIRVQRWKAAYHKSGIRFAADRTEAQLLRDMVNAGWFDTSGETQAKSHRLTEAGIFQALWLGGQSIGDHFETLLEVDRLCREFAGRDFCGETHFLGWRLCEKQAGEDWEKAFKSKANWNRWLEATGTLDHQLGPLLIAGWVSRRVSANAHFTAYMITDRGRAAIERYDEFEKWEPIEPDDAENLDFHPDWEAGFKAGQKRFIDRAEPPDTKNLVPYLLPNTQWMHRHETLADGLKKYIAGGRK